MLLSSKITTIVMVIAMFCSVLAAQEMSLEPVATDEEAGQEAQPAASCSELMSAGDLDAALHPCRDELAADPESIELQRKLAFLEFSAGDPAHSAELWRAILDSGEWDRNTARSLAMAVWRAGSPDEAEQIFRDILDRVPDELAYRDLMGYMMSFDQLQPAAELGARAVADFPDSCQPWEDLGVAEAALDHDEKAAELIGKAVDKGCPPFAWTGRGVLPQRLDDPAYADLLSPARIIDGLGQLDDEPCRERLRFLKLYMNLEAAPAVTEIILNRRTSEVRFAGLGLMVQLGSSALPYWKQILDTDDFILEKHALRRIREMADPAFIPLVRPRLKADQTPGNRALTKLVLGELLLKEGETQEAEQLLTSVSKEHSLYPIALMTLADYREKSGDDAGALELIELALASSPELYVDPGRLSRLRGEQAPVKDPAEAPDSQPTLEKSPQQD